ncbi:response regulator transcription factor [Rhodocyclus tenuis]|uniref:Response regulator n=2 Tax=Rhodocyclus TaxID=1064 RepID=A0A6L5K1D3_RHOTE|nr:response regulator transcription factor [Rhodocyclus gracilis]MQY52660.1 response regulator [Rhodocyclus gracilis]MRD73352.1 response regulator [Rhodocyclus gracilis]NJA88540.1 response regulator transcription factor [Rhodocyclus gracilis]
MLKLLVVEDHTLVREGLVRTLCQLESEVLVLEAADCDCAAALLEQEGDFDLILLDLGLPGIDGLTCLSLIRSRYPTIPVVIVSAYDDALTVARALKAGASGFVPKAYSGERLLAALREVLNGGIFAPDRLMPMKLGPELPPLPIGGGADPAEFGLTERQVDVLSLMVRGKSNRDIGIRLGLTEGTVKIHTTAIFKALGVSSRTQALVAVNRFGIRLPR